MEKKTPLEEYKYNRADSSFDKSWVTRHKYSHHEGFKMGFDAAIALDLPVRFSTWKDNNIKNGPDGYHFNGELVAQNYNSLYDYWVKNILQIP